MRRLYYAEHWKIGTIATGLGASPDAVRRALSGPGEHGTGRQIRPRITDPYLPLLRETLELYPRLRATRLYQMARERGYTGSVVQLRRVVRKLRPSRIEAFVLLTAIAGESGQADWADFGPVQIGRAERRLSCFVMVLAYSRAIYAEFFLDQTFENFARGHIRAFTFFGGVPRRVQTDNLRSVVLERRGSQFRFNPRYLELAGTYHFQPAPCRPARGNEKGRVERAIRYLRDSFFGGRTFSTLTNLNTELHEWIREVAHARPWAEDPKRTVAEVLREEQPRLLALPPDPSEPLARCEVQSGKTIYVRFDRNDYSIPHAYVRKPLSVVASDIEVRILDGSTEVARHRRSYDRAERVTDPVHADALLAQKRRAAAATTQSSLEIAVPLVRPFLDAAFPSVRSTMPLIERLRRLYSLYGAELLSIALKEALARNTPTLASLEFLIEKARRTGNRKPPLPLDLTDRPDLAAIHVQPHQLRTYDELALTGTTPYQQEEREPEDVSAPENTRGERP